MAEIRSILNEQITLMLKIPEISKYDFEIMTVMNKFATRDIMGEMVKYYSVIPEKERLNLTNQILSGCVGDTTLNEKPLIWHAMISMIRKTLLIYGIEMNIPVEFLNKSLRKIEEGKNPYKILEN